MNNKITKEAMEILIDEEVAISNGTNTEILLKKVLVELRIINGDAD